jgi:CBS domain containing-hemolysin-like protein
VLIDTFLLIGLMVANGSLALSEIAIVSSRRTRLVPHTGKAGRHAQ